ncbi:hypothetical protein [Pseudomonas sp. MWU13-2517]|uniref:hypothetical protein n=1 Tax=Pseudomonas sp. MWU13-2517 TaxID=2929055 RepID=UPI00200DABC8|nr:hypothetical protein [Pseudomonas sp. MWU13-2517]
MWNSGVSGVGYGRAGSTPGVEQLASAPVAPVVEAGAVKKLLNELFDAEQGSRSQTVRDVRDKLNAVREKLGDEKFKALIDELSEEATTQFREFLKRLLREWFPDTDDAPPSPSPSSPGGGRGPNVPRSDFGPSESMSNKPITEGAKHFNYKPDSSNPGKKPDNIWSGFSQGPDGNCITVSAIKAAMMQYGQKPTDVYKEVKERGDGYDVTMRDGFKLHLSKGELQLAAKEARFRGDDPQMMTDANFMYAVSAKRAQMENNDGTGGRSYQSALNSLNDGEDSREGLDRLGLKGRYRPASDTELRSSRVGTVEYDGHSMAVIDGRIELWRARGGVPKTGTATVLF